MGDEIFQFFSKVLGDKKYKVTWLIQKQSNQKSNHIKYSSQQSHSTQQFKIACWNIRTLQRNAEEDYSHKRKSPNDKLPILIKETKRLNLDFLCLLETRLLGSDNLEFDDCVLVWSGKVTEHQSGVAILMKKKFTTYKLTIEPISDRILKISLPMYNQGFTVIATYAPTNPHAIEDKMQFYEQLQKSIDNIPEKTVCIYVEI